MPHGFSFFLAGVMLFLERNMVLCESAEDKAVGRTDGRNMFLKIASLPQLCTLARIHRKSQGTKAILIEVPKGF